MLGAAIGLIAWSPVASADGDVLKPEDSLLLAAHSSVVPMSETGEWLNGPPPEIPAPADPASVRAPAISAALAENDVFIMVTGDTSSGLAVSRTAMAGLAEAEASVREVLSDGARITDNGISGADVSGSHAMMASIPASVRHGGSGSGVLGRMAAPFVDALDTPEMAPENVPPVALVAHGDAINGIEFE
jgi:hypothetical protein